MYIKFTGTSGGEHGAPLSSICPFCGAFGNFRVHTTFYHSTNAPAFSLQICPKPDCSGLIVVLQRNSSILKTYPGIGRPINVERVPDDIRDAFLEAEGCFANGHFVAAAIMLRKTVELICENMGATGKNLYQKIDAVGSKIIISKELLAAMHELRLLGNDAAHVTAEVFDDLGRDELDISFEFVQEIIKAIYQHKGLLEKFNALKKRGPEPPAIP